MKKLQPIFLLSLFLLLGCSGEATHEGSSNTAGVGSSASSAGASGGGSSNNGDASVNSAGSGGSSGTASNDGCTELTAEEYENNEGNNAEFTAKFFPTDNRDDEYIDMFFRSSADGTHLYGEGKNADLYTCDQCMLIVRNEKNFYPVSGSITIEAGSEPEGKKLIATLSTLKLIEIEISDSYHSVPVIDGECVTLAPAAITVR